MTTAVTMDLVSHEDVLRPLGRPWTVEDLYLLPDDGLRYEIIDGSLHVSPPPDYLHAQVGSRLLWPPHATLPPDLEVIIGAGVHRVDVVTRYLEPDLMVVHRRTGRGPRLAGPQEALLVVEVVSPSSVTHDRVTKRALYAEMGVDHYWMIDIRDGIRLTALRRKGDAYVEHATAAGDDVFELDDPFPVRVRLADLIA